MRRTGSVAGALAAVLLTTCALGGDGDDSDQRPVGSATPLDVTEEGPDGQGTPPAGEPGGTPPAGVPIGPAVTDVAYRIEVRTADAATADFPHVVHRVLTDPRGWVRAGYHFRVDEQAPYLVVLAEGAEVDRLCHPYETRATYSCQNGPVVALNADRWRHATPQWPADLDGYRTMLVNHEVGHLLHLHHPEPQCPGPGLPAPVMAQQSTELGACLPHPWPLEWEVDLAAQRREPLAPGADHDASGHRAAAPPARR